MYAFIAPVTDQTAITKPRIVKKRLEPGFASARFSDPSSSVAACAGMTVLKWWMRLVIAAGEAMRVQRPVATISTAGVAKTELYAIADACSSALSRKHSFSA